MTTLAPPQPLAAPRRDQLILRYAPLVRHAVGQLAHSRVADLDPEDMYGYGTMGLIDAIDRFDASRGVKFETYAVTRIRGYLLDQLRALDWLPRSARSQTRTVRRAAERLESRLGRHPNRSELASEAGLSEDVCQRALADSSRHVLSLEEVLEVEGDGSDASLAERLEDQHCVNPAMTSEKAELRRAVSSALARLPTREALVLRLRYGQEWSLKQIAERLKVSESRISQLHTQALTRIRQVLSAAMGDQDRLIA